MKTRLFVIGVFIVWVLILVTASAVSAKVIPDILQIKSSAYPLTQELPIDYDVTAFITASVLGVPLLWVVQGLVQWSKKFKSSTPKRDIDGNVILVNGVPEYIPVIHGNGLLILSLCIGAILGAMYMISVTRPPGGDWYTVYVYWFGILIYGLGLGLIASGQYKIVKDEK